MNLDKFLPFIDHDAEGKELAKLYFRRPGKPREKVLALSENQLAQLMAMAHKHGAYTLGKLMYQTVEELLRDQKDQLKEQLKEGGEGDGNEG